MAKKLIQKDTGMEILISDRPHYGRDVFIINRLMHELGFIENKGESNLLSEIEIKAKSNNQLDGFDITVKNGSVYASKKSESPKLYAIDKFDVDVDIRPWSELTIDHGNITTDTETFRKFIDLCGNNKIKLNIINGNINMNGDNK